MITTLGKASILRYLSGQTGSFAQSLAIGALGTAPTLTDKKMAFQFGKAPVSVSNVDYASQRIIFKGSFPQEMSGSIYEVGIFSGSYNLTSGIFGSRSLASFDGTLETWSAGTYVTANNRIGKNSLAITTAASSTTTTTMNNVFLNLSGYSSEDIFTLLYNVVDQPCSVSIRFIGSTAGSYYQYTTPTLPIGYGSVSFNLTQMTKIGTAVDLADIRSIEIVHIVGSAGSSTITLEGFRVEDNGNMDDILVARSVLAIPRVMTSTAPFEVEYSLGFNIT